MIQIFHLQKTYEGNNIPALSEINLHIQKGEFCYLCGPSGAGKSTLMKILMKMENYNQGQILIQGMNLAKIKESKIPYLRREIGVVFQDFKLLNRKTVFDNIAFPQEVVGKPRNEIKKKTWELLKYIGLAHKKDAYPLRLSGGEQQRVAIARALANDPSILLADEPMGNLDEEISMEIMGLFERANQYGATVLLATHNLSLTRRVMHRKIVLERGKLLAS
ncbi:MAG: cell division ATP-binding protein FtsE [Nitrospinae bacterium]|nr:cell division ATP-binding protein FtsE [Nitrospinota bacterium]